MNAVCIILIQHCFSTKIKFSKALCALHMNVNVNMGPFQIVNKEKIETVFVQVFYFLCAIL